MMAEAGGGCCDILILVWFSRSLVQHLAQVDRLQRKLGKPVPYKCTETHSLLDTVGDLVSMPMSRFSRRLVRELGESQQSTKLICFTPQVQL